jgi:hypothetical protein
MMFHWPDYVDKWGVVPGVVAWYAQHYAPRYGFDSRPLPPSEQTPCVTQVDVAFDALCVTLTTD